MTVDVGMEAEVGVEAGQTPEVVAPAQEQALLSASIRVPSQGVDL